MSLPITGISSMATKSLLADLAAAYRKESGREIVIESVGGVDAARRVQAGEPFDFVVLAADAIDTLAKAGRVGALGGAVGVARSGVAVAVRSGAPVPDISTSDAVREAVRAARSIGVSTGPSGVQLAKLFEHWGIADEIGARIVTAPPGVPVASLLARGEVELGFQQLSELMNVEGVQIIGMLPADIAIVTTFCAAVCSAARQPEEAASLLGYLAGDEAAPTKRRHGMDPA